MGRRRQYEVPSGSAERERQVREMDLRLFAIQRALDRSGSDLLARELRQARSRISDLLNRRD